MRNATTIPLSPDSPAPSAVPASPLQLSWKTLREDKIQDIVEWVRVAAQDGQQVNIGTDSLQSGKYTQFVTVVAILTPTKGGRAAYCRFVQKRLTSLRERLWKEVWLSTDLAMSLSPVVPGEMIVHIDANPAVQHKSSAYVQELVGLVVGQGFKALIKPDSWAATHAADWTVRNHGKFPLGA